MFQLPLPILEKLLRPAIVYLALVSSCINERMVYSAMHEGPEYCTYA